MTDFSKYDQDGINLIKVDIVADSLAPNGVRMTSFVLEYNRYIHGEIMTHRVLSKNAASSRAIPINKVIKQVIDNPAIPVWWGAHQSGMQANAELSPLRKWISKQIWLKSRYVACAVAYTLSKLGLHKQVANRLLEPWFVMKIIMSGTDYDNFFALRAHKDAQPEFQVLAYKMLDVMNASKPKKLSVGEWHIPFGDKMDYERLDELPEVLAMKEERKKYWPLIPVYIQDNLNTIRIKIATARCARVSYYNFEGKDDYQKDIDTCNKLFGSIPRHLSPTEHVAQVTDSDSYFGNMKTFKPYRKFFSDENLSEPRLLK